MDAGYWVISQKKQSFRSDVRKIKRTGKTHHCKPVSLTGGLLLCCTGRHALVMTYSWSKWAWSDNFLCIFLFFSSKQNRIIWWRFRIGMHKQAHVLKNPRNTALNVIKAQRKISHVHTLAQPQSPPFTTSPASPHTPHSLLTRMAFIPEATPYVSPARRAAYVYSFKSSFSNLSNK